MKLKEIIIDPKQITLDRLKSQYAGIALAYFTKIQKLTNNFYYTAYEIFPADIIHDWLDELTQFKTQLQTELNTSSQTYKIIEYLIKYFEND